MNDDDDNDDGEDRELMSLLTWIGVNPGCVPTATHTPRKDALAKSCSALRVMASNGNKNNQSKCDHGNNERRQSRTIRD